MHAGCNVQSYGSGEHNHALVAFLPCILGRHGACKHLGCSEHAASGRRDPVGVASRNRLYGGIRTALWCTYNTRAIDAYRQFRPGKRCSEATKQREHACAGCKHKRAFFTAAKHNETTQTRQKSKIYIIATMIAPESHTRGGSSCYRGALVRY